MTASRVAFSLFNEKGKQYLSVPGNYHFTVQNNCITENYILNAFWNWITVNLFPEWLAPNLITFAGFLCVLLMHLMTWYFYPTTQNPYIKDDSLHKILYVLIAILVFLYQTLDGCDGKQARRTKTSSPLGEVFDHGADALAVSIMCFAIPLGFGVTIINNALIVEVFIVVLWIAFQCAQWEHKHTEVFYMGYLTTGDGLLLTTAIYLIDSVLGIEFWNLNPVLTFNGTGITFGQITIGIITFNATLLSIRGAFLVHGALIQKGKSFADACLDWIPIFAYCGLFILYAHVDRSLFVNNLVLFITFFGLSYGVLVSTGNVARATGSAVPLICPQYILAFLFPILGLLFTYSRTKWIFGSFAEMLEPKQFLIILTLLNLLHYLWFATTVTRTMCEVLKINTFTIPVKGNDKKEQ